MTYALWIIQVLLALLFLFAGGTKLVLPIETLMSMGSPNQIHLPGLLIRFIGVCEVLGALGLILPGLLRTRPGLTPLAAAGLVIIMIGATALTFAADGLAMALPPLVVGILAAFVAYGRWRLAPHRDRLGA
ncbi:MAG: DoxX family protein [Acidobacteriota bacterium]|nr:DoxX family protein [Acidobacteriota bacterium]